MRTLDNGNLLVPWGGKHNGMFVDGLKEVGPDDPDWGIYMRDLVILQDEEMRKMERIRGAGYCAAHAKRFPGDDF